MKEKSVLRRLIPWLVALALIAALVIFVGIPLYGTPEETAENPPVISYYEDGKQTLTMENDSLLFELDATNTQFRLLEKKTGREWLSNPADAAQDKVAIAANKATLQSTLIVTYSSASGVIDFNNYTYSIENGTYTVGREEDGSVAVTYSVGKIEKIYMLPSAITVERFNQFVDTMNSKDSKKVKNVYSLIKPDKLDSLSNKDELLSMYPEVENQELYILKSDTSENNKKNVAAIFEAAGYTQEDYDLDLQLVAGAAENTNPVFNVTVIYRLDGDDFLVEIPYDRIRYRADYPITYLTVLPMFGAAGVNDEGFMFIPEGGGALIRYNNGKLSQNSYYANLYGWDYGSERTEVVSETKCSFPVFGMTRSGGSFICILEGAPSFGGVQADISMRYNSYNWICAKYNVLHSDKYNVSAKTANLVYMFEKEMPQETIRQRYRFIDSDEYSDMAVAYGDYLREIYPDLGTAEKEMPVSVELVGAIDKKVVRFGLPIDAVVPTTTFSQAESIIKDLQDRGVKDLSIRMSGWCNGGVDQKVLTSVKVIGSLGGENGMKNLIRAAKDMNVPLYFDGISCFAYRSGLINGFIPYRDAARFTTREQIIIYPYSNIYYQQDESLKPFYLVQPSYAQARMDTLINALSSRGAAGVAFRDIGYLLSGDYNPKDLTTREQVRRMNIETMLKAKDAGENVMIKEGFDYAMPYADLITDMDLTGIEYSIIDESVPFYQIAIHGSVNYTGLPINLQGDWETELLHCAEYGAGLNFTFMAESAEILQDTNHSAYYGASYSSWADEAARIITEYQSSLAGLNGMRMTGHRSIASGISETTYEDGRRVLVNYTSADYTMGNLTVPARSYLVEGGAE